MRLDLLILIPVILLVLWKENNRLLWIMAAVAAGGLLLLGSRARPGGSASSVLHRPRFLTTSPSNPAGNVLPYYPRDDPRRHREPASMEEIGRHLMKGIPVPASDRVFGHHYGGRETIPVDHVPDKTGFAGYLYSELSSCKDDRVQCLPAPNRAIGSQGGIGPL